jgi:hypothetical protein
VEPFLTVCASITCTSDNLPWYPFSINEYRFEQKRKAANDRLTDRSALRLANGRPGSFYGARCHAMLPARTFRKNLLPGIVAT